MVGRRRAWATRAGAVLAAGLLLAGCGAMPWIEDEPEPVPGGGASRLLAVIDLLEVAEEGPRQGYSRELFDHWVDINGSGCTARQDVLVAQAVGALQRDPTRWCVLVEGDWYSLFDGVHYSGAPSEIDVDHVVALAEAWDSGASEWPAWKRQRFANDPLNLLVATRRSNQDKADLDAGEWKPPRRDAWCITASMMALTKLRYALSVDRAEREGLRRMARHCDDPEQLTTGGFPLPGTSEFDRLADEILDERAAPR